MPYIKKARRDNIRPVLDPLLLFIRQQEMNSGDLNYIITKICKAYMGYSPLYPQFNDIVGALENAKIEFIRRNVAPFEDLKILENGDI